MSRIPQNEIQDLRAQLAKGRAMTGTPFNVPVCSTLLEQLVDQAEINQERQSERRRAEAGSGGHQQVAGRTLYSPVTVTHRTADQSAEHAVFMDGIELKPIGRFNTFEAAELVAKCLQAAYNDGWLHGSTDVKTRVSRTLQERT